MGVIIIQSAPSARNCIFFFIYRKIAGVEFSIVQNFVTGNIGKRGSIIYHLLFSRSSPSSFIALIDEEYL